MHAIVSRSLVVVLLAAAAPTAIASDIHVPADFSLIQDAINAASSGDVVLVDHGHYAENIDFKGKAITVRSIGGPSVTTIDGGASGSVVRFASGEGTDSVIEGFTITNGAAVHGGGVYIDHASPTVRGNWITANTIPNGGNGAGVYVWSASPVIDGNVISFNYCKGEGGGIDIENFDSVPVIVNNLIVGNHAVGAGGGVETYNSAPQLTNNSIIGNISDQMRGSGLSSQAAATPTLSNCIVWGNADYVFLIEWGSLTIDHSDVQGGFTGTGNISTDPLFVDPANGDYHLSISSPCINAGDALALDLPSSDIDGDARIIGASADMGSDEALLSPIVLSVAPSRARYDATASVTVSGLAFSVGTSASVSFGGIAASNVLVIDDQTITCDVAGGLPGPADVTVSNSQGSSTLPSGFVYTPAVTIEGDTTIGSSITIHDLCDPGDGIFAVFGLPPAVSVPTPPFDGDLAIVPFHYFFYVTAWPFDSFDVPATIPNDPALVGVDVLLQSLIGPQLTKPPKDGSWTNCAVLSIR